LFVCLFVCLFVVFFLFPVCWFSRCRSCCLRYYWPCQDLNRRQFTVSMMSQSLENKMILLY
jgi:hypothetical protein